MIQKGTPIEAICKDTKYTDRGGILSARLMNFFMIPLVSFVMSFMKWFVDGRKLQEAKERELAEEEALLKAMQRGELPQGDE